MTAPLCSLCPRPCLTHGAQLTSSQDGSNRGHPDVHSGPWVLPRGCHGSSLTATLGLLAPSHALLAHSPTPPDLLGWEPSLGSQPHLPGEHQGRAIPVVRVRAAPPLTPQLQPPGLWPMSSGQMGPAFHSLLTPITHPPAPTGMVPLRTARQGRAIASLQSDMANAQTRKEMWQPCSGGRAARPGGRQGLAQQRGTEKSIPARAAAQGGSAVELPHGTWHPVLGPRVAPPVKWPLGE